MPYALTSQTVSLGGNALASYLREATLVLTAAELDATDMASGGWTEVEPGLKSGQLNLTFNDDIDDNALDEIMWGLWATKAAFTIRNTSASVGTGNPQYSGTVHVKDYNLGGAVGSLAGKTISCTTSGAVSRATA